MKVFIGGEIESNILEKFRMARNIVLEDMNCLSDISGINELSFYIFCMKDFTTKPMSRYLKNHNRVEVEILLSFDKFEIANESQCVEIIKQSIFYSMKSYKNKNTPQMYIDIIVERIKSICNNRIILSL